MAKKKNKTVRPFARKQKAASVSKKTVALKMRFRAAHQKAMKALERHDYDTLETAIQEEARILDAQNALITNHLQKSAALSRNIAANLKTSIKAARTRTRGGPR